MRDSKRYKRLEIRMRARPKRFLRRGRFVGGPRNKSAQAIPLSASKYAAGPTFSDVELRVETIRSKFAAPNAPSLLTACEIVSRALHGANAPLECGYGRIALSESSPWKEEAESQSDKITIHFRVQSVLQ